MNFKNLKEIWLPLTQALKATMNIDKLVYKNMFKKMLNFTLELYRVNTHGYKFEIHFYKILVFM